VPISASATSSPSATGRKRGRAAGGRQVNERVYPGGEANAEGVLWSGVL